MSTRAFDLRPRVVNGLLLPVLFALSVAAGVIAGDARNSAWVGVLGFFVAWGAGRGLRRLIRRRLPDAVYALLWPVLATAYTILFALAGLPDWAAVFLAVPLAWATKLALGLALLPARARPSVDWAKRLQDLDASGLADVVQGRATRKR